MWGPFHGKRGGRDSVQPPRLRRFGLCKRTEHRPCQHIDHGIDEFLVIASDVIFEFLTNQYVMNVCTTSMNPLEACEQLTKAAYDHSLTHENRTDDITIIVCFLSCTHEPSPEEESETTEALIVTAGDVYGTKPLRSMLNPGETDLSSTK